MASKRDNSKQDDKQARGRKRAVFMVSVLLSLLILGVLSVVAGRYLEQWNRQNRERIYGEWIEQNVPSFARDRFVVREEGIYVEERIVDTDYDFNGRELRYHYQGQDFVYKVKDEEMTLLQRVEPLHYRSEFKLTTEEPGAGPKSSGPIRGR
jgi:hypothetical protein